MKKFKKLFLVFLLSLFISISINAQAAEIRVLNGDVIEIIADCDTYEDNRAIRYGIMPLASNITLTFNPNGGTVNPTSRLVGWNVPITSSQLPTPTRNNRHFVDWFNTSATSGGTRIRAGAMFTSNTTIWARWTDSNRHNPQWWRPATSGTTTIALRNFNANFNSTWTTPMNLAISGTNSWSRSTARVNFTTNSTSNNRVSIPRVHPSNPSALGRIIYRERNGTNLTRFDIELFSDTINNHVRNNANATLANVIQSVMAHELGHAVGLRDNPSGAPNRNDSIMNTDRQRWIRRTPSNSDIANVNMIY